MGNEQVVEIMEGVLEIALREIVVELVEKGVLERYDIAKAMLRTEIIASIQDEETPQQSTEYARILQKFFEKRLGAKPQFCSLRHEREAWLQSGQRGPDPWESVGID